VSSITTQLGATIRLCRTKRGLQLRELADRSDLSVSYLSLLEKGKRTCNLAVVERIAKGLDIPLFMLVYLATDKSDLVVLDKGLAERLAYIAWRLIDPAEPVAA
jgi:transcriptional regulator with XRE-family HTH domain